MKTAVFAVMLVAAGASAQVDQGRRDLLSVAAGTGCAATWAPGMCVFVNVAGNATFQVGPSGTWSGTVVVEGTGFVLPSDGVTDWVSLYSTTAVTPRLIDVAGYKTLRIRASSLASGTVVLNTYKALAAKQPALGTAGTPSADVISVQGVTSMTALAIFPAGVPVGATQVQCSLHETTATVLTEITGCVVLAASVKYYITKIAVSGSAATTASNTHQIFEGDGANCATNPAALAGGYAGANDGFNEGNGSGVIYVSTAARGLCLRSEEAGSKTVTITAWTK